MVASVFTACNKESFTEPVQGEGRVFTASFADTKATSATGVVTFKAGETIDLWYMDGTTAKRESIAITDKEITNEGKSVVFNSTLTADKIMAVYPGSGDTWSTATSTSALPGAKGPKFTLSNSTEGVATGFVTGGSTSFSLANQLAIISCSADAAMTGSLFLFDNRASAKSIYTNAIIDWETGKAVGDTPMAFATTNKLSNKDDMRFVVVPTLSLPEGFTIKTGTTPMNVTDVVSTSKAFTAEINQFLKLGNINRRTLNIDIAAADITYNSAVLTFTPSDVEAEYIPMLVDKEYFDKFTSDEEIVADDIEFFELLATIYEMEFEEVLDVYVVSDVYSEAYEDLDPETAQVAYAYGFSKEKLIATSPVFTTEFTTLEKPGDPLPDDLVGRWICPSKTNYSGKQTYTNWVMTISRAEDGSAKIENIDAGITAIAESIPVTLKPVDAYWLGEDNTLVIPDRTATGLSAGGVSVVWRGVQVGAALIYEDIAYEYDAETHTLSLVNEAFGTESTEGEGFHTLYGSPLVFYKEGYEPSKASYEDFLGQWSMGSDLLTITEKVAGSTYNVSGIKNQTYPNYNYSIEAVEASFEDGFFVLREQKTDATTSVGSYGTCDLYLSGVFANGGKTYGYYPINANDDPQEIFKGALRDDKIIVIPGSCKYGSFESMGFSWVIQSGTNQGKGNTFAGTTLADMEKYEDPTGPTPEGQWYCASVTDYWGEETYTDWTMTIEKSGAGFVINNFDQGFDEWLSQYQLQAESPIAKWSNANKTLTIAAETGTGISAGGPEFVWRGMANKTFCDIVLVFDFDKNTCKYQTANWGVYDDDEEQPGWYTLYNGPSMVFTKVQGKASSIKPMNYMHRGGVIPANSAVKHTGFKPATPVAKIAQMPAVPTVSKAVESIAPAKNIKVKKSAIAK